MHRRCRGPSVRMVELMYDEGRKVYNNIVVEFTENFQDKFCVNHFCETKKDHRDDQLGVLYGLSDRDELGILPMKSFKSMTAQVEFYKNELLEDSWGDLNAVSQLIECGTDIVTPGKHGMTPLHVACRNGSMHVLNLLLVCGADASVATHDGVTPLFVAAEIGRRDLVRELAKHGAKIDAANALGETPLLAASRSGHADVVAQLLELGADARARTVDGVTPMSAASSSGHDAVAALLAEKLPVTM